MTFEKRAFKKTEIGSIPVGWRLASVEECMEAIIDYRGKTPKKVDFGVPLVTARIVKSGRILEPQEFIREEDYDGWMRRGRVRPGDVIITTEAPLGEVAQLDERKVALAQRIIALRGKPGVMDNRFLRFVLQSPTVQNEIRRRETGTTVSGIKQKELRKVLLPVAPVQEQRQIGEVLSCIDDKIELNYQMNATLEQIGQALFKHWFVDFEFPNEKGKPYKSSGGEMVDSELGEIPKGWEAKAIGEIAKFYRGFSYSGAEKFDTQNDYVFVTLNNVREGGGFKPEYSWIKSERLKERHFLKEMDLIISNTEQTKDGRLLGFPAIVYFPHDSTNARGVFSHHISKVEPNVPFYKYFLYYFLLVTQKESIAFHTGSVIWGLDVENFSKHRRLACPPLEIASLFNGIVGSFFSQLIANERQNTYLSVIRDSLLPKLMSGRIRTYATKEAK